MQVNHRHARGRRWEAFARYVVSYYGGVCHLCLAATVAPGLSII